MHHDMTTVTYLGRVDEEALTGMRCTRTSISSLPTRWETSFFSSHSLAPAHGERGTAHHLTQHTSAYVSGRGFPTLPTQPRRRTPPPITWQRAAGARSQGPRLCASPPVEMKTPGTARMDRNRVFIVPAHIPELADDHLSNFGPSGRQPHNWVRTVLAHSLHCSLRRDSVRNEESGSQALFVCPFRVRTA